MHALNKYLLYLIHLLFILYSYKVKRHYVYKYEVDTFTEKQSYTQHQSHT